MLVPGVGSLDWVDQDGDQLNVGQKGVYSFRYPLVVEIVCALLEHSHNFVGSGRKLVHVPIDPFQIVRTIEELQLFEVLLRGKVGLDGRMHREETVQGGRTGLLRTDHQKVG